MNHGANRDDGALLVAHRKLLDVLLPQAEARIRLHVDLEDPAEFVELVDVARAKIGPERREHVVDRAVELLEQRTQILALAALAPVLEHDIGDAGIGQRRIVVERGDT